MHEIFPNFNTFVTTYKEHNERLWELYRLGQIKKEELRNNRFVLTLNDFNCNDIELATKIGDDYIELSPQQTLLFPGTIETLEYLAPKYKMHIITNGFVEVQYKKLRNSKLEKYFDKVITSEEAKASKPKPGIFHSALSSANAKKAECLMIGDDLNNDIIGAKKYGFDQVFFNPNLNHHQEEVTYEIKNIPELKEFL